MQNEIYSLVCQTDKVSLRPHEIVDGIKNSIRKYINVHYEGKVLPSGVYIIKVIDINYDCIKHGLINEINAVVLYEIEYSAFVFEPVVGKSFNITVKKCNDIGIWGYPTLCDENTCIECISSSDMFKDYEYREFENEKDNGYYCGNNVVKVGSVVSFKILNRQIEHNKIIIFGVVNKI